MYLCLDGETGKQLGRRFQEDDGGFEVWVTAFEIGELLLGAKLKSA